MANVGGYVEVGVDENYEVVINLDRDRNGIGHLVFSPKQARNLAVILLSKSYDAERQAENIKPERGEIALE
jgi:hypothetical protein